MDEVCEILETWKKLVNQIHRFENSIHLFHKDNEPVIKDIRETGTYILEHIPLLKACCANYLEEHRSEIFLRFWLNHIYSYNKYTITGESICNNKFLHPSYKDWFRYFPKDDFEKARALAEEVGSKRDVEYADEEIKAHHKDKICGTWDMGCDWCDDIEVMWHQKLYKIFDTPNIFLNKSLHEDFIKTHKDLVIDCDPPKIYVGIHQEYTYEETLKYIDSFRKDYSIEKMRDVMCYGDVGWKIYLSDVYVANDYRIFCALWSYLDVLSYIITKDLEYCDLNVRGTSL